MISKENFVKILNSLKKQDEQERKMADALGVFCDGHMVVSVNPSIYDEMADVLTSEMGINDGWIEWWMWDCDFGQKHPHASHDIYMPMQNLEKPEVFYDFLLAIK